MQKNSAVKYFSQMLFLFENPVSFWKFCSPNIGYQHNNVKMNIHTK